MECVQQSHVVALHCYSVRPMHATKFGPCKIVTPENFSPKLCTRDCAGDGNHPANFGANWLGGVSLQLGEI